MKKHEALKHAYDTYPKGTKEEWQLAEAKVKRYVILKEVK